MSKSCRLFCDNMVNIFHKPSPVTYYWTCTTTNASARVYTHEGRVDHHHLPDRASEANNTKMERQKNVSNKRNMAGIFEFSDSNPVKCGYMWRAKWTIQASFHACNEKIQSPFLSTFSFIILLTSQRSLFFFFHSFLLYFGSIFLRTCPACLFSLFRIQTFFF